MKRIICFILALLMILCLMATTAGCGNRQILDMTYTFNHAILSLPNGKIVEGKVSSWKDYEDGDQIQVVIDGKTYLVHSSNIALIND